MITQMSKVYVVSDSRIVLNELVSALDFISTDITTFEAAPEFLSACYKKSPDLAVLDMQVKNMGGIAISMELHLEESGGRLPHVPILLLLDRRADVFLAKRAKVEGYLVKPLESINLGEAATAVLSGHLYHDRGKAPKTVAI